MSFVLHRNVGGETRLTAVERDTLRIGRGANADLRLDDDAVALEHARIEAFRTEVGVEAWVLSDRDSVTGTYLNGQPVVRAELAAGDVIEIGGCRIKVQITDPEDPLFLHLELPSPGPAAAADAGGEPVSSEPGQPPLSDTRPVPVVPESPAPADSSPESTAPEAPAPAAPPPSRAPAAPAPPAAPSAVPSAAAEPDRRAAATPRIDYVRAYSLSRPGLTKASVTLGLTVLAVLLLTGAVAAGVRGWFMPGISSAHGRIVGASPGVAGGTGTATADRGDPASAPLTPRAAAAAELGCLACHRPWRGPADAGCAECHQAEAVPHASRQMAVPACNACHPEHRPGQPLITSDEETGCVSCHGNLAVAEGEPRVARRITSFAEDHPELVVTPRPAGPLRDGARPAGISLAAPGARSSDPGRLAFNHRVHLAAGLRGPRGVVQLTCAECHTVAAADDGVATGRMAPIAFEEHCQSCHRLSFDAAAYPDREAPHAGPQEVEDFLVGLYSRTGAGGAGQSLRQRRLGIIRGGGRQRLPSGVDRQVADAGRTLFRSHCDLCHEIDLDATPLPTVEPPRLPARWLARALFSHLDHGEVACNECHRGVAESSQTSDVLLPGIAECRSCHGTAAGTEPAAASRLAGWGGLLGCAQCHAYHAAGPVSPPPVSTSAVSTSAVLTAPMAGGSLISTISTMQPEEGRR